MLAPEPLKLRQSPNNMRIAALLIFVTFLFSSCEKAETQTASGNAKRYPVKGKVVSVDKAAKKARIDHGNIDGFMEAMTMDFPIHADWVWDELTPGSEIKADLVVDSSAQDPYWLENIGIIATAKPGQTEPPIDTNFIQIGKAVPDFTLTDQNGQKISINDYRGKALAVTFIYARCPLPEYCIKMSTNFSDLAIQLNANTKLKDKIRLLSISFDPANDTPAKLKSYGTGYLGRAAKPDFTVWHLAIGDDAEVRKIADFFGLRYKADQNDKTQINHNLRTAVIGPDGTVTKIFSGNEWTPADLLRELESTI